MRRALMALWRVLRPVAGRRQADVYLDLSAFTPARTRALWAPEPYYVCGPAERTARDDVRWRIR